MDSMLMVEILKASAPAGVLVIVIWKLLQTHKEQMRELLDQHNLLLEQLFTTLKTNQEAINSNTYNLGQIITALDNCKKSGQKSDR